MKPLFYLVLMLSIPYFSACNQNQNSLTEKDKKAIIETCVYNFNTYYVYPDIALEMGQFVKTKLKNRKYKNISSISEFTKQLKKDFRSISNDRHIWIDVIQNLPVKNSNVSDEEKINELIKTNFGFDKFEILTEHIAYLRLTNFVDLRFGRDTAVSYMNKLSDTDIIILDLRENHGGNSNMVHFISSYFFKEKVQLNSMYFREADSLVTSWTNPDIPGGKLDHQKLFILTSENTTSAAESFTYTMKNYKRATIIGETTRGAAHWVETYQFPELGIFIEIPVARPINPITQRGWEGIGVLPDVEIKADEALDKAKSLALEN